MQKCVRTSEDLEPYPRIRDRESETKRGEIGEGERSGNPKSQIPNPSTGKRDRAKYKKMWSGAKNQNWRKINLPHLFPPLPN